MLSYDFFSCTCASLQVLSIIVKQFMEPAIANSMQPLKEVCGSGRCVGQVIGTLVLKLRGVGQVIGTLVV